MSTIVNSWNEWDPLKHVIVGRADDCHIPPEEPALDAKVPEDSDMRGQWGRRPQDSIDRANELLDNFATMLASRGIKVDRPTPIDFSLPAITPDFQTESQFGCMPPRRHTAELAFSLEIRCDCRQRKINWRWTVNFNAARCQHCSEIIKQFIGTINAVLRAAAPLATHVTIFWNLRVQSWFFRRDMTIIGTTDNHMF